jgi:hypothetical protein
MSENADELKKALAENANFDATKADRDVSEANDYFDSRLRRAARITWLSLVIVTAVLEFAIVGFLLTFSTKAIVGFAVLLVISIVLIGVFAIDQRITNTKINLLREIKLLRLEHLGLPTDQTIAPRRPASTGTCLWQVLSLRENVAWFLALMLVAAVSNYFTMQVMDWGLTTTDESQVTLLPDGSGSAVHKVSSRYRGVFPLTSFSLWSSDSSYTITQWLDGQGRELPVSVSSVGANRKFTAQFIEPVMPGERFSYTTTAERAEMAKKQGETWTYRGGWKLGGRGQEYVSETIRLPRGAEIVSVEPKPAQQFVRDGLPTVRLQAIVDQDHQLEYTIQYRLPKENGTQKAPK